VWQGVPLAFRLHDARVMVRPTARPPRSTARRTQPADPVDINATVAGLLRDLAFAQTSRQRMFGYKRAAAAVFALEQPLSALFGADATPPRIPGIGPASTRVIRDVLETGGSPAVERAVAESGQAGEIQRRRALRSRFLSRAATLAILSDDTLEGPSVSEYRGDLQMHSEWSDGAATLDAIVDACVAREYSYAAVTDHSYGLRIAGGMSMTDAAAQRQAIEALNAAHPHFRLLRGIEANIGDDGRLDLTATEATEFELVLAAPHSKLRKTADQTGRLLEAVRNPRVHVLAHPRGRLSGSRGGLVADWDLVFAAAAAEGVAIEIDGDPARQDVDYRLAARAVEAGCVLALDSDAHATSQFHYVETALAHARLAAIPVDRIVNCWTTDRLLGWLGERSSRAARFIPGR
jgi:histidinol phosphatase-like PHP family hydrolase